MTESIRKIIFSNLQRKQTKIGYAMLAIYYYYDYDDDKREDSIWNVRKILEFLIFYYIFVFHFLIVLYTN